MQVLTDQIKVKRPGTTIYGIGDEDHQDRTSGHNPDDTSGVKAEDQDTDLKPEHRAIDVMLGATFSSEDADGLVNDLVTDPDNQWRLIYVNWGNYQWSRNSHWQPEWNGNDPHPTHVHISGEADADENTNLWNLSNWGQENQDMTMFVEIATDPTPRPIYKSDGFVYEHLTSGSALASAQAAGYQVITVPDRIAFEALCGKPYAVSPPIVLTPEQVDDIAEQVAKLVLRPMADASKAEAAVLDEAAGA